MADEFEQLRADLKNGEVLTEDSEGYQNSLRRWSEASIKPAKVVVRPGNADEVSITVKFATANKIPFVVCSGGHSTSGASSSDKGMVIDLSRMNYVKVDPEKRIASYGGGCRWVDVDSAVGKHGLAAVGGTVNDTGVGGLSLGGGYGWLSSRYGLVIDNLVQVQVVLADGRIVKASDAENTELFWAIRGAGQNYGVITEFTSKLHPVKTIWGGMLAFPLEKMAGVIEFANNWDKACNEDGEDRSSWVFGPTAGLPGTDPPAPGIVAAMTFLGSNEEAEKFYKPLFDLGPLFHSFKEMPYPEINYLMPSGGYGIRRLLGGSNCVMPLNMQYMNEITKPFIDFAQKHAIEDGTMLVFEFIANKRIRQVKNNETAFGARSAYYHVGLMFSWKDEKLDSEIRQFNRKTVSMLKDRGFQGNSVGSYLNYDGGYIDPKSAFGDNLDRLRQLKSKYDPDNVFWKWHSLYPRSNIGADPDR